VLHVNRTGGNKGVDTARLGRLYCFTCAAHVILAGARQRANGGLFLVIAAPGLCSPSRKVVSKIINLSVMLNSGENKLNLHYRYTVSALASTLWGYD
jgi:hypothetical protein